MIRWVGVLALAMGCCATPVLATPAVEGEGMALNSVDLRPILVWSVIACITLIVLIQRETLRLRSGVGGEIREVHRGAALFWLVCAMGVYLSVAFFGSVVSSILISNGWSMDDWPAKAISMWGAYLGAGAGIVALVATQNKRCVESGIRTLPLDAVSGIGAFALAIPIVTVASLSASIVADLVRGAPSPAISHSLLADIAEGRQTLAWWAVVGGVVLAAPVIEEFIYRGFLQTAFRSAGVKPWGAIVATSAIFALAHSNSVRPEAMVALFVLSLAFGVAYERSGRIGVPIVMHAAFNTFNLALMAYAR